MKNYNYDASLEDKFEVNNNYISCLYCGIKNPEVLVQCGECDHKFCNGYSEFLSYSHILTHLKKSYHKSIKIQKKKINEKLYSNDNTLEIITCGYCNVSILSELFFYKDIENKKIDFLCQIHYNKKIEETKNEEKENIKKKYKKIIFEDNKDNNNNLNTHFCIDNSLVEKPQELEEVDLLLDCEIETVNKNEEIIQLTDPITQRFLNKVKDKYNSSDEYYEIYKPLIFSEFYYVKKIYESKPEFPIELKYDKKEKILYFEIEKDFNVINLSIGKRFELSEEPKKIEQILNINNEEEDEDNERGAPIHFTAAIIKINIKTYNKQIIILPLINKDINKITNNLGIYYLKENFCEIPYVRMLKGLDSFNNENKSYTSNLIHSQILGLITNEQIKELDEKEMKNIFNDNELITKIDNFGELNTHQKKCMNKAFTHSLNMVQGPPGTGKTFLASFIIYNIFQKRIDEEDKILVCAPSNTAADNLALYLLKLNNSLNFEENKEGSKVDKLEKKNEKINQNKKKRKMNILRVYSKSREIIENNKILANFSLHRKLDEAIEQYKKLQKEKKNKENQEEEEEDEEEEEEEGKEKNKERQSDINNKLLFSMNKKEEEKNREKNKNQKEESEKLPPNKLKNIKNNIIKEHDIIISTCSTTFDDKLYKEDFKYVLIDEATQCCEIEGLLPILHGSQYVILIGDQKQLGPTILYPRANLIGINISLFERMIKIYPENYIMLKKQYRMNEQLSKFPSDFFYEGKIKNSSKHQETKYSKKILKKFCWPKKDIPIMFININNKTTINYNLTNPLNFKKNNIKLSNNNFTSEKNIGKSFENELEANITIKVLEMLNSIKSYKKEKYNVGIITPYLGQKKLILEKLANNDSQKDFDYYNNNIINIASVDSFQGKEKDFIIINTVRSNYKNYIGFVKDPRRLNVSLTRAKHGLIIIGDALCLANSIGEKGNKYSVWRYLIKYYQDNGLIVDYNEGKKGKDMFSKAQILNNEEKLEKYNFQEYDYDGKYNRQNVNRDYIDNFDYLNHFHYIDDRDYCINNGLFSDDDNDNIDNIDDFDDLDEYDIYDDYEFDYDEYNDNDFNNEGFYYNNDDFFYNENINRDNNHYDYFDNYNFNYDNRIYNYYD